MQRLIAETILYKKYNSEEYPKYDSCDAINVNKTVEIPMDYKGAMGVPITFLNKYNPDQSDFLQILFWFGKISIKIRQIEPVK